MLLVLNLPMIGMWVQLLKLPYNILFPLIILFTIIGVYCSSNNVFDVYVMIAFGVIGYFMRKLGYEPAPLVLAFVLGPMMENNLRKSLILSQGDLTDLRDAADLGGVSRARGDAADRAAVAVAAQEARAGRAGRRGVATHGTACPFSPRSQNSPAMIASASSVTGSRMCSFGACCEQPG